MNNFDKIAKDYEESLEKPDKKYSILPTVLKIASPIKGKIVLDLGCGSGFFSVGLAKNGAKKVMGIDNSPVQLKLAEKSRSEKLIFIDGNIFYDKLPSSDLVIAPFVINYSKSVSDLEILLSNIHHSLEMNGKLVAVVDLPDENSDVDLINRRIKWGAVKNLKEGKIEIILYNKQMKICKLSSAYFSKETLEKTLQSVGFKEINWHQPIISLEGINRFGKFFWRDYIENPELGYLTAIK